MIRISTCLARFCCSLPPVVQGFPRPESHIRLRAKRPEAASCSAAASAWRASLVRGSHTLEKAACALVERGPCATPKLDYASGSQMMACSSSSLIRPLGIRSVLPNFLSDLMMSRPDFRAATAVTADQYRLFSHVPACVVPAALCIKCQCFPLRTCSNMQQWHAPLLHQGEGYEKHILRKDTLAWTDVRKPPYQL
ncbi:hypothetical protein CALVIDRAFT_379216 [Calocera viscosa TUFC12733]|uniref:Uncharacterized protein n=1 Tax=Calocera viscosa (strain TUFC12733) TaxID=1330018 RepID=A0A167Q3J6_CALVF|nr:hypothetical protein CALVIDRAFT_379216 [Calocera viscosa TUFC12733]